MRARKLQIENTPVFVTVFLMFIFSFGLIVYGLLGSGSGGGVDAETTINTNFQEKDEDVSSLSEHFKTSENKPYEADDVFIKDDPFAEMCASVSGDGVPSVHSNTVCLR